MKISELDHYQIEAKKTLNPELQNNKKECQNYLCMKLAEETGEVISPLVKYYYHGKDFNRENFKEELGDAMFYIANLALSEGFSLSEIAGANIEKLRKRHGNGYKAEYYTGKNEKEKGK
jgi:NTP pyrophosphatase (non-canonical NTP hydrolase)